MRVCVRAHQLFQQQSVVIAGALREYVCCGGHANASEQMVLHVAIRRMCAARLALRIFVFSAVPPVLGIWGRVARMAAADTRPTQSF